MIRNYFFVYFIILGLFAGNLNSESVDTKITQVRLYQNRAYVRRSGELDLEKNSAEFSIDNIPVSLINSSINISFEPKKFPLKVKRVQVIDVVEKVFQNDQAKEARKKYEELLRKLSLLNNEFSVLVSHKEKLNSLTPQKKDTEFIHVDLHLNSPIWNTVQKTVGVMLDENVKQEVAKLGEIDSLREELLVAEAKLDFYKKAEEKVRKKIKIDFQSPSKEKVQFHLDYMVTGAEWYPRYAVKVDTSTKINSLFFYALVRNNSGEDWKHIDISFSAADPNQSSDLPVLKEWRIGYEEVQDEGYARNVLKQDKGNDDYRKKRASPKSYAQKPSAPSGNISNVLDMDEKSEREEDRLPSKARMKYERSKMAELSANEYNMPLQAEIQAQSKDFLLKNKAQSRSFVTEQNLNSLKSDFQNLQNSFRSRNYSSAIDYGKQAKEKILRLNDKHRKELAQTFEEIDVISKRSAILQSNSKLGDNLVSPVSSSGGFDYRYHPKSRETILSDSSFNKILISTENLNSELQYETSPLSQKSVFLSSTSLSRSKEPLLAGPLDLFVKEDFLGTSALNMTSKGEELKFDLGPDNNIEVDRRETRFREKKGIISEKNSVRTSIVITLKNKKSEKINLKVIDRIPYTFDKDVDVELVTATPTPEKKNYGSMYYKMSLGPNEEKKIQFEYVVRYPSKNILKEQSGEEIE